MSPRVPLLAGAAVLLWAGACLAGAGKTGFDFLNDPPGARSAAMGGTAASAADDAEAALWNPAALAELRRRQVSFGYASFFDGMSQGTLAYGHPLSSGALGFGVRSADSGDIPSYSNGDIRSGSYAVKDLCLSAGYARAWGGWRWGANLKRVSESLAGRSAGVMAADLGVVRHGDEWPVAFSAALRNVGGKASFAQEKFVLPRSLDLGANVRLMGDAVLAAAETRRGADGENVYAAGMEVWTRNALAVRAGWESGDRAGRGLSLGLGVRIQGMRLDYAFLPQGNGFSPTHRMGLSWAFGGEGDKSYEEGLKLLQEGRNAEAVLKFQKALDADPRHVRAIRALREAARRLNAEMREDVMPEAPR
jgi:hypothetical protein